MAVEELKQRISELEHALETAKRRGDELELQVRQETRARERETIAWRVREAAMAEGVVPEALDDVSERAIRAGDWKLSSKGELFRVESGVPVVAPDGQYVGPCGFIRQLKVDAPFYFRDFAGEQGSAAAGAANPWSAASWSLSAQAEVYRQNPETAARLAEAAGSRIGATQPTR